MFYRASFAFVLQRCKQCWHRAKPIPLKMHASLGSPSGRAPEVAGERVVVATICPLRRLRRHLSQRERLFVSPIITQIGRENKFSADFYVCPFLFCVFQRAIRESPLQNTNILMRRSLSWRIFLCFCFDYQITILFSGAMYMPSVSFTPNASYHSGKFLGGMFARRTQGP